MPDPGRASRAPIGSPGALRGHAVEHFVEMVVVNPVALVGYRVQRRVRYLAGLIDAAREHDVAIRLAVPNVHGDPDVSE